MMHGMYAMLICWEPRERISVPMTTENLSLIHIFIAVIAGIVQLVEMVVERFTPSLYASLGIFLPLIAVNLSLIHISSCATTWVVETNRSNSPEKKYINCFIKKSYYLLLLCYIWLYRNFVSFCKADYTYPLKI